MYDPTRPWHATGASRESLAEPLRAALRASLPRSNECQYCCGISVASLVSTHAGAEDETNIPVEAFAGRHAGGRSEAAFDCRDVPGELSKRCQRQNCSK